MLVLCSADSVWSCAPCATTSTLCEICPICKTIWPTPMLLLAVSTISDCWYFLNPGCSTVSVYRAGSRLGKRNSPEAVLLAVNAAEVSMFLTVTGAPTTTAPWASTIVPDSVPAAVCAKAATTAARRTIDN